MHVLTNLVLLSLCVWSVSARTLGKLHRRQNGYYPVYYSPEPVELQPFPYGNFPMQTLWPLILLLLNRLLYQGANPSPRVRPTVAPAPFPNYDYMSSRLNPNDYMDEDETPSVSKQRGSNNGKKRSTTTTTTTTTTPAPADSDEDNAILYARPDTKGGFSYRRPSTTAPKPTKSLRPVILKIKKYKIVRNIDP